MIHHLKENIYTLYIKDERINVTGIHRFLVFRENQYEWINASNLKVNDLVLFANGKLQRIFKIDISLKEISVYNFEVSNNHNYYVGKN